MRNLLMSVCAVVLLAGCTTENEKKKLAEELYTAIYAGDEQQAASVLKQEDAADLPVLDRTPAQVLAAKTGQTAIVKQLLDNGAEAKATDGEGNTLLHAAMMNGDMKLGELLKQQKTLLNTKTKTGWTPLFSAMTPTAAVPDRTEAVAWLLKQGADANAVAETGWTALHEAVYQNQSGAVKLLLPVTKQLNRQDRDGTTPLMAAVRGGNGAIVKQLLTAGADVNIADGNGYTALSYAVLYRLHDIAAILLEQGADPTIQTKDGQTCKSIAGKQQDTKMLQLLQTK